MQNIFIGTCSVCDHEDVQVRHFETNATTGEGIDICLECQPPSKGGGDGRRFPHLNPAAVALALADAGFRGPIRERCLSMLTRWAQDRGLHWMVAQVLDDTGLTLVQTSDIAGGAPNWFFLLWLTRDERFQCERCAAADELLYFPGEKHEEIRALCDRCHLAQSLTDVECFRCTTRSEDLIFVPIEEERGSEGVAAPESDGPGRASKLRSPHDREVFGIYLCPTCHLDTGPSPAKTDFWDDAEITSMYTDEMAVSDGVLIDLEALGVKAEYKGLLINRMTSHLFHQVRNTIAGMHGTIEDPVLAAELEATLKAKLFFAHDAEGDGFLITLPGGSDDNPIWLVRNEVGGYTAMFANDY